MVSTTKQRKNGETISVVKAQATICPCMNFAEGIVLTRFSTLIHYNFRSALVLFAVTANYLFSKYRLQALVFKTPASYRPLLN